MQHRLHVHHPCHCWPLSAVSIDERAKLIWFSPLVAPLSLPPSWAASHHCCAKSRWRAPCLQLHSWVPSSYAGVVPWRALRGPSSPISLQFPLYHRHLVDGSSLWSLSAVAVDATSSSPAPHCPPTRPPAPSTSPSAGHRQLHFTEPHHRWRPYSGEQLPPQPLKSGSPPRSTSLASLPRPSPLASRRESLLPYFPFGAGSPSQIGRARCGPKGTMILSNF
jgi:hypothetical protein